MKFETKNGDGICRQTLARDEKARILGYTAEDLAAVPAGANLGLGCGNPTAIAAPQRGETILDLGSGPGSIVSWPRTGLEILVL